jgi:hypothetical protein
MGNCNGIMKNQENVNGPNNIIFLAGKKSQVSICFFPLILNGDLGLFSFR